MQFVNHRRTALQYPLVHWTLYRCLHYGAFSMKALARYQVILLGEQRHIRCDPTRVSRWYPTKKAYTSRLACCSSVRRYSDVAGVSQSVQ